MGSEPIIPAKGSSARAFRLLGKAGVLLGLIAAVFVAALFTSIQPPITLTILGLTNVSRATSWDRPPQTSVVAIVEMKNSSKQKFSYPRFYLCPDLNLVGFYCQQSEKGTWKDYPQPLAELQAMAECPSAVTGQPWWRCSLEPAEKVVFKADIPNGQRKYRVMVALASEPQRKLSAWQRWLPESVREWLWMRNWVVAKTPPIHVRTVK